MWTNKSGCKKSYYIKEYNPNCDHVEKTYLRAYIKGKSRLLIAQLRTSSHHLRCDTGRWRVPNKVWEDKTFIFCNKGVVEREWHFVMECVSCKDIHIQYESSLKVDTMLDLFDKDKINQIPSLLVKIYNIRSDIENNINMS